MSDFAWLAGRAQSPVLAVPFHEWVLEDGTIWTLFYRTEAGYLLRFPDLADFQVSADTKAVTCRPVPGISDETARHLYLNQVLPLVLSKQGKLVFHASAVEVDGGAIAFLGMSGSGKSTLAASFATSGLRFLTDDALLLERRASGYQVLPSHPSIRLWQDSQDSLIHTDVHTAPPVDYTSKSRFLAGKDVLYCEQPKPLRRAYFLGDGSAETITIQSMSEAEALIEWVKHSFLLDIEAHPVLASHFDRVANLADRPIHFRLDYPRRFDDLARIRRAILEHARERSEIA